ncbi:MAG TPA: 2Fe-2S iron-sulfur cluster-binding protein, partial [Methanoregula sp.]|nr:2Fe-2S iron-sulfur cluster-binding protein [Methanoregula sp.]
MGKTATVAPGTTVLSAIRSAGILVESICGGKGECNKCRVIHVRGECDADAPAAVRGLTEQEVQKRYCRACQTHVFSDCEFIIPIESVHDEKVGIARDEHGCSDSLLPLENILG